jgi:hypothetical protein
MAYLQDIFSRFRGGFASWGEDGKVLTNVVPHGGRKTCHPADIRRSDDPEPRFIPAA